MLLFVPHWLAPYPFRHGVNCTGGWIIFLDDPTYLAQSLGYKK